PSGFGIRDTAADDLRRQATHGPATQIEKSGLACQRLAVLGYPHHVPGVLADTACRQYVHNGVVAVQVVDVLAEPPRDDAEVDFGLNDDAAGHDVQTAGEPQQ